jgi:hypothetical protein
MILFSVSTDVSWKARDKKGVGVLLCIMRHWSSLPLSTQRPILSLHHKVHIYLEYHMSLSLRRNWDPPPTSSPASECVPPPHPGGTRLPADEGLGESQFGPQKKEFTRGPSELYSSALSIIGGVHIGALHVLNLIRFG